MSAAAHCETCGVHLPPPRPTGPRRKYCSERCRKVKYATPCVECGAPRTNGSDPKIEHCAACGAKARGRAMKIWTPQLVLARIHEWTALHGEPPAQADWSPTTARGKLHDENRARRFEEADGYWPWFTLVVRCFGSWNAAIRAAGYQPRVSHGGGENAQRQRSVRNRVAA